MNEAKHRTVWALLSHRAGEGQQILGLAEAMARDHGMQLEVIRPTWRTGASLLGLLRRRSLLGLAEPLPDATPDLVITSALRNEPIARALRARGARVVIVGRSWAAPGRFDLVVTTPQYRVPPQPAVLENLTTQHRITPDLLDAARRRWADQYAGLPRPRIGLLVGGDSGPYVLGHRAAARLADQVRELAGAGSLMVTTSARTRPEVADLLEDIDGARVWRWRPDADNPYAGILAWADQLVVTADSIAMVSEAVATGVPVWLFDPGGMGAPAPVGGARDRTLKSRAYALMMRTLPRRLSRDIGIVHERLVASGRAAWLGGQERPRAGDPGPDPVIRRTTARIAALLDAPTD